MAAFVLEVARGRFSAAPRLSTRRAPCRHPAGDGAAAPARLATPAPATSTTRARAAKGTRGGGKARRPSTNSVPAGATDARAELAVKVGTGRSPSPWFGPPAGA